MLVIGEHQITGGNGGILQDQEGWISLGYCNSLVLDTFRSMTVSDFNSVLITKILLALLYPVEYI